MDTVIEPRQRLAELLWKLNVTNKEAALNLGVHERTIYKWLAGNRDIPAMVFITLQLLLDKKAATLMK
jgi:plasmid maintenance system antidote protein VapI